MRHEVRRHGASCGQDCILTGSDQLFELRECFEPSLSGESGGCLEIVISGQQRFERCVRELLLDGQDHPALRFTSGAPPPVRSR